MGSKQWSCRYPLRAILTSRGPPAHPRPSAGPAPQPLRIGAAADLLRVPAAAADRAGAVIGLAYLALETIARTRGRV